MGKLQQLCISAFGYHQSFADIIRGKAKVEQCRAEMSNIQMFYAILMYGFSELEVFG